MRALIALGLGVFLSGCTSLERQESIQRKSLEELGRTLPVGTAADSVSKVVQEKGWKILSDQATTDWPGPDKSHLVDRVFTIALPKRAGVPFSFSVFGYAGSKDGRVVVHHIVAEANAL